jgi:hypothetical protein
MQVKKKCNEITDLDGLFFKLIPVLQIDENMRKICLKARKIKNLI